MNQVSLEEWILKLPKGSKLLKVVSIDHAKGPDRSAEVHALKTENGETMIVDIFFDREKYVPGLFECPKCKFVLTSNTLYMKSGTIGANNKPQECSNGCGPMWRVSWKQHAETLRRRLEAVLEHARKSL